jgi:hypothetical protein
LALLSERPAFVCKLEFVGGKLVVAMVLFSFAEQTSLNVANG